MIKIYHNKRCSKSREGLRILENSQKDFQIINYLESVPSKDDLKNIIHLLGLKPIELIRKNGTVWKEHYKGKNLSDEEIVEAMAEHPKLMERPIVVNGKKAVVGRPPERILEII